jgi:N-acetylglucosamine kinase-like BadF-type ATPase
MTGPQDVGNASVDYFLGVDIGGSKSHALIADETGWAVAFGEAGAGNYEVVGWDGLRKTLQAVTGRAMALAGLDLAQIAGAGFGIAGYDWPGEREPTRQAIESLGLTAPFEFANDAVIALAAGARAGWGVVVIAGTSNNCRGLNRQGLEGRVTGCGPTYGEYGGASEMVAKAIQAVAMAWSQRGPTTRLTEAFVRLAGAVDVTDLLEGLILGRYQITTTAAPTVFQVADQGDCVAERVVRWAGRELGSLAVGVIHQLELEDQEFEVVLAGSLYDGGPLLVEEMRATIHAVAPGACLVRLTAPPVIGGVLLGMKQTGMDTDHLRDRLIESTKQLLHQHAGPEKALL